MIIQNIVNSMMRILFQVIDIFYNNLDIKELYETPLVCVDMKKSIIYLMKSLVNVYTYSYGKRQVLEQAS